MAKILVVDDNPSILDMLRILLPMEGHEVSTAADGSAGLRLAESTRFDLALIDVDLPGLDGISLCKSLKNNPAIRNMPVLLMTGRPGLDVDVRSGRAGALMVLAKPFSGRILIEEIARLTVGSCAGSNGSCAGGRDRPKKSWARRTLA